MTNRGLISKYMNSSYSSMKSKSPIKKMGRKPKQILLQRRHRDGQPARKDAQHWHLLEKCQSKTLYMRIHTVSESKTLYMRIHTVSGSETLSMRIHTVSGSETLSMRRHTVSGSETLSMRRHTVSGSLLLYKQEIPSRKPEATFDTVGHSTSIHCRIYFCISVSFLPFLK